MSEVVNFVLFYGHGTVRTNERGVDLSEFQFTKVVLPDPDTVTISQVKEWFTRNFRLDPESWTVTVKSLWSNFRTNIIWDLKLDEIALGLAASGVRFLWILREQSPRVRELIGDTTRGMMILPWCNQLKVLCHPSVGGFLTHCGMNSTLEAVFAGVPLFFDQPIDSRLIVEEWKVGLELRDWTDKNRLIVSEEIARAVKRLMASDVADTEEIKRHALGWKEVSGRAVKKGGSSYRNLSSLMEMLCSKTDP